MGRVIREMPEAFPADASKMTQEQLKQKYHAGVETVRRWLDELSLVGIPIASKPRAICPYNQSVDCSGYYMCMKCGWNPGAPKRQLRRISNMGGRNMSTYRAIPEDFAEDFLRLDRKQLRAKYRVSFQTINDWIAALPAGCTERRIDQLIDQPGNCIYRMNIECHDPNKCQKCGWCPDEQKRIITAYINGGMERVRGYIRGRDEPPEPPAELLTAIFGGV